MASTYSNLKIQLMTTGENNTTWGNVTNVNLGTAIEEAITGSADVAFSSANVTLTLTDTNATQTARNLRLNLTGTSGGARNLIVPAIEKVYIVNNGLADAVTVKNATGTGIAVPAGKTMWVFNDGANVVDAVTALTSLTLATALSVTSGGTGANTLTSGYLVKGNGTSAVAQSVIYDTGTNVGIGTATPAYKLDVYGGAGNGRAQIDTSTANPALYLKADVTSGYYPMVRFSNAADASDIGSIFGYSGLMFTTLGTERMRIEAVTGNVGVGTSTPSASALLDVQSTTKGVRLPNMTTTQKNAISSPAAGLLVFDTTLSKMCVYTGSAWQTVTSA